MFRVWGKIFKDNRMLKDITVCDGQNDTRTHKVFRALDEICYAFGWTPISASLSGMPGHVSVRTALSTM